MPLSLTYCFFTDITLCS
ncbi:uncharacterized protein FPRN_15254 [Fusarium proliferatum]|nr:uncharacterized protein FPRN_15254 [Fusarium proliferatum]